MANLFDFIFTSSADSAVSGNSDPSPGWQIPASIAIDAKEGNDLIEGRRADASPGISLANSSSLTLGKGNDWLIGSSAGGAGIWNDGAIFASENMDTIRGEGIYGILNNGIINTEGGSDAIIGESFGFGGIVNSGEMITGRGNDSITGTGSVFIPAIINDGLVDTGPGNDTVNGQNGGFWGSGTVALGSGADTLIGICTNGTVAFHGDRGRDRILLADNVMVTIAKNANGSFSIRSPLVVRPDGQYSGFELIGGLSSGTCIELKPGTLFIDSLGMPSYI